ncbi:hypothetical protein EIP86_001064 [Pleurotus ostreatoroseus]|nr:hypothetical protein EIP86_001064 [Pleurotus ostreatoroseus]
MSLSLLKSLRAPLIPRRLPRPLCVRHYLPGKDDSIPNVTDFVNEESEDDSLSPRGTAYGEPNPPTPKEEGMPGMARTPKLKTDPIYSLYVKSTKTNTIVTFAKPSGNVLRTFTGGSVGFKRRNRSTYEAGHQCAMSIFEVMRKAKDKTGGRMAVQVFLNGFGQGRDAMVKALAAAEGDDLRTMIVGVTDKTPIKIGGTRAKKARRL